MVIQAIGVTASVISIMGFLFWLGRTIYRQASAPKGYAAVLTGVSLKSSGASARDSDTLTFLVE